MGNKMNKCYDHLNAQRWFKKDPEETPEEIPEVTPEEQEFWYNGTQVTEEEFDKLSGFI